MFARKYALESSRRDLQNALLCTVFGIHNRKLGKKEVHCVDLEDSFQTHISLQNLASIQPRTSRRLPLPAREGLRARTSKGSRAARTHINRPAMGSRGHAKPSETLKSSETSSSQWLRLDVRSEFGFFSTPAVPRLVFAMSRGSLQNRTRSLSCFQRFFSTIVRSILLVYGKDIPKRTLLEK